MVKSVEAPSAEVNVLANFVAEELMPDVSGLAAWDLGCGAGSFSIALAEMKAKSVLASDLALPSGILNHPKITFVRGDVDAASIAIGGLHKVDLVFMHLMSEHVINLKGFLQNLHSRLRPGAELLIHHDNYFQPVGHHDHGLIALNESSWEIEAKGPKCWDVPQKCDASADRRAVLRKDWGLLWSEASEASKDPENCHRCNYYRRSQPWAHLIYGDELRRTFPESFFRTAINRLSPAQVRWDVQDADFSIVKEKYSWILNKPPDELVTAYGKHCLQTFTMTFRILRN
jgi:SAM-dependent methyltransferase